MISTRSIRCAGLNTIVALPVRRMTGTLHYGCTLLGISIDAVRLSIYRLPLGCSRYYKRLAPISDQHDVSDELTCLCVDIIGFQHAVLGHYAQPCRSHDWFTYSTRLLPFLGEDNRLPTTCRTRSSRHFRSRPLVLRYEPQTPSPWPNCS